MYARKRAKVVGMTCLGSVCIVSIVESELPEGNEDAMPALYIVAHYNTVCQPLNLFFPFLSSANPKCVLTNRKSRVPG